MRLRKWLMKQQWRVIQIRGIWGLFYGILLLAIGYYEFIPFFLDMGPYGPFAFAGVILVAFLILGYIYDRVLVMWAPSQEVIVERNPYQYIPGPKETIYWMPLFSALLNIAEELSDHFELDKTEIIQSREYYRELMTFRPERPEHLAAAERLRADYISSHPFSNLLDEDVT
ncbi:MAG: hypothetical protein ACFFFK_01140 [Candidatus Thorarchaeota archaeon]